MNLRLSRGLCAAVGDAMRGSHGSLDALFRSSGAPGEPPNLSHATKWKEWLFRAGQDSNVDSLSVLGNVLEEFMDVMPPEDSENFGKWKADRERVLRELEENGLRYFRGGRVLPTGQSPDETPAFTSSVASGAAKPTCISELLQVLIRGLRRAMHPLSHRRKGAQALSFSSEYDVQDLLHAMLRPWVADIRPEEFTPSYAGRSTRMDFLLPKYRLVLELKFVRDRSHAGKIGDELIVDIDHYQRHPDCDELWCVVFDQDHLLPNAEGLKADLEGVRTTKDGRVNVRVFTP
jgi:REase_DpnII-MboI